MYVHIIHTTERTPYHGGGLQYHSTLFIYFPDLHFLFVWAASIPECRTRTQCLSLSSSSSVLKSAASNPAVSGCFHFSRLLLKLLHADIGHLQLQKSTAP